MVTAEEFSKEMVNSHWCKECDGKIILIEIDYFGNTKCGYCGRVVHYPRMTKEELEWELKKIS